MKNEDKISDNYQKMLLNTVRAIRQQAEIMLELTKQYENFIVLMYGDPKSDQKVVGLFGNKQE